MRNFKKLGWKVDTKAIVYQARPRLEMYVNIAYWGTPDQKYILEIGIKSSQFEEPLKNLDLLKNFNSF